MEKADAPNKFSESNSVQQPPRDKQDTGALRSRSGGGRLWCPPSSPCLVSRPATPCGLREVCSQVCGFPLRRSCSFSWEECFRPKVQNLLSWVSQFRVPLARHSRQLRALIDPPVCPPPGPSARLHSTASPPLLAGPAPCSVSLRPRGCRGRKRHASKQEFSPWHTGTSGRIILHRGLPRPCRTFSHIQASTHWLQDHRPSACDHQHVSSCQACPGAKRPPVENCCFKGTFARTQTAVPCDGLPVWCWDRPLARVAWEEEARVWKPALRFELPCGHARGFS